MKQERIPLSWGLTPGNNEDVTTSYIGFTREQKREMLTHALIAHSGENAISATVDGTRRNVPKEEKNRE